MVLKTEGAIVELYLQTLDVLIRLREKSTHNVSLTKKIDTLQYKLVDEIAKNLNLQ